MKTRISNIFILLAIVLLSACQSNDYDRSDMIVSAPDASSITGQLQHDDYVWQWNALPDGESMQIATYRDGTLTSTEVASGNTYVQKMYQQTLSLSMCSRLLTAQMFHLE